MSESKVINKLISAVEKGATTEQILKSAISYKQRLEHNRIRATVISLVTVIIALIAVLTLLLYLKQRYIVQCFTM